MIIKIWFMETSEPLEYEVINSYTKGRLFCVLTKENKIIKFPLCNIFRIEQDA